MLKKFLCLGIALLILCPVVFADTLQVSYEPQRKVVTIAGSEYMPGQFVKLTIPALGGGFIYADQIEVDTTGGFTKEVAFPQNAQSGEYTVTSVTQNNNVKVNFKVYNLEIADTIVKNSVNAAGSGGEIQGILEQKYDDLGFYENEILTKYLASVCEKLYQHKNSSLYAHAKDFTSWYYSFFVVSVLSAEKTQDIMDIISPALIHVDIDGTFLKELSLEDQEKLFAMVLSEDFIKIPLKTLFSDNKIFLELLKTDRWSVLRDILEPKLAFLGLNQDLNQLKSKQQFFMDLYEKMDGTIKNINAFKDVYQRLYQSSEKIGDTNGDSGYYGGGGTGGGNPSKNVSLPIGGGQSEFVLFSDVKADDWFYEYILALHKQGVVKGFEDGTFAPNQSITRGEFCKLIVEAFEVPMVEGEDLFADVSPVHWFYPYVTAAAKGGLVYGYDRQFAPNRPIKRQDAAVILYRILDADRQAQKSEFADREEIGDYALDAIDYLASEGIVGGDAEHRFLPHKQLTRGEASKLIYLLLSQSYR